MFQSRYSNISQLWAALILEELYRLGVRHICIAPGSRSSPLMLAADKHSGLTKHVHFDERGLGFFALGLCKATQQAVVVITTSGTAVANLLPSFIEASQTDLPLIVLSADRPPELIDCGANQAIRQPDIFADYPRYKYNMPVPNKDHSAKTLLGWLDKALASAQGSDPGPVHLNVPLREPLYPTQDIHEFEDYLSPIADWRSHRQPLQLENSDLLPQSKKQPDTECETQWQQNNGIIIAGALTQNEAEAVGNLAAKLDWPIFADIQSQLRHHPQSVGFYDQLMHSPAFQHQLADCHTVLQFGGRMVSKRLQTWLECKIWKQYTWVGNTQQTLDPANLQTQRIRGNIQVWCEQQSQGLSIKNYSAAYPNTSWAKAMNLADQQMSEWLAKHIDDKTLSELSVTRHIAAHPKASKLFIGNSLPIRLLDMFCVPAGLKPILSNRGASGIDGLLATAIGCKKAKPEQPLTLLIGDMSLMHDLNSLMMLKSFDSTLVIVVLNNGGGNIFRLLPVPEQGGIRDRYYQLPHSHDFQAICESIQIRAETPNDMFAFAEAYNTALETPAATMLQVCVRPEATPTMIQKLSKQIRDGFPAN